MVATILAIGAARRAPSYDPPSARRPSRPGQPVGGAGHIPLLPAMPAVCNAEAIATPQLLRDIGFRRRFARTDGAQLRDLPEFPATSGPKTRLNFAAFYQASSPARHSPHPCQCRVSAP